MEIQHGLPHCSLPYSSKRQCLYRQQQRKFYSIRLANGTLNWVTDGLNGYIESRPAIDHERIYIGTWGAMFYAIDRKTGKKYGNSTPNAEDTSLREPAGPQCCPTGRMEKHQNRS